MTKQITRSLLFALASYFMLTSNIAALPLENALEVISQMIPKLEKASPALAAKLELTVKNEAAKPLSEEFLYDMLTSIMAEGSSVLAVQDIVLLEKTRQVFIDEMKTYKPCGPAFTLTTHFQCVFGAQESYFTIDFVNQEGKIKTRAYRLKLGLLGFGFAVSLDADAVFFFGENLDYFNTRKEITLGSGIEVFFPLWRDKSFFPIRALYVQFTNAPGSLIILGQGLGCGGSLISTFNGSGSVVFDGALTPMVDA